MSVSRDLVEHYALTHPDDVARHVERLDPADAVVVLSALAAETTAALVPHLAPAHAARIVTDLASDVSAAVVGHMGVDDAASLLRRVDPAVAARVLGTVPDEHARAVGSLLTYGPATAGGVMDPQILTVPVAATVAEARALLESMPEHLYYFVYVVDVEHRLVGVFDLAELQQADADQPVRAIAHSSVTWLSADAPLASVFAHPGWRTLDAMPVVDDGRRFLGVLRHRTMRQLQEQDTPASGDDRTVRTVMALGEIYWLGLCGLLQGIAVTASESAATEGDAS